MIDVFIDYFINYDEEIAYSAHLFGFIGGVLLNFLKELFFPSTPTNINIVYSGSE
jgi:membrane associated rhomboid family serine protease